MCGKLGLELGYPQPCCHPQIEVLRAKDSLHLQHRTLDAVAFPVRVGSPPGARVLLGVRTPPQLEFLRDLCVHEVMGEGVLVQGWVRGAGDWSAERGQRARDGARGPMAVRLESFRRKAVLVAPPVLRLIVLVRPLAVRDASLPLPLRDAARPPGVAWAFEHRDVAVHHLGLVVGRL
eukprot:scaffold134981_cov30-Tisochrysis_lutea.AAC.1